MTIVISQYAHGQEQNYVEFPLTSEGLREAKAYLDTPMNRGFRRGLSPWQFESAYGEGQLAAAYRLLEAGDVDGLKRHLVESCPQI